MKKPDKIRIGPRTIKTAVAVILSMLLVDSYGTTTSRLVFAMLGAMAAVQPTFQDSLESCLTQIIGVAFGAVTGSLLMLLKLPTLLTVGIGIVLVITLYNTFHIRYSPGTACLIVVILCTTADIKPFTYALGRIWDTAIGLVVGMVINTLVFPYDNSRQIRSTVESLDRELILFLEEMFDGDDTLPDAEEMVHKIDAMDSQLKIFSNQRLLMHRNRQKQELASFQTCERKARELVAQMEVLSAMQSPGHLNEENRRRLEECGAEIRESLPAQQTSEADVVTNYHVAQILTLRQELLDNLR